MKNYPKILIGKNNNENIYLSPPKWDCGWYWGFGYLGNKDCHYHVDGLINKENCNLDYDCSDLESLSTLEQTKCNLKKEGISVPASIRLQNTLSEEWDKNPPTIKELSQEITCKENPDSFRGYLSGVLRQRSSTKKFTKSALLIEENDLLSVVEEDTENLELRSKLMDELSRTYYYLQIRGSEADNIFETASNLLEKEDEVAIIGVGALVGALADVNLERSKNIVKDFIKENKDNPEKYEKSFSAGLAPFVVDSEYQDQEMVEIAETLCQKEEYVFCRYIN